MSDSLDNLTATTNAVHKVEHSLKRRHKAERNFKRFGLGAIILGLSFVAILFVNIVSNGYSAFMATHIALDVTFDAEYIDKNAIADGDYRKLARNALSEAFPEVSGRGDKRELYQMISSSAEYALRDMVLADSSLIGQTKRIWLLADDEIDMAVKGIFTRDVPENERVVSDQEFSWLDKLAAESRVEKFFNWSFFTNGDSREPEQAGIGGAIVGSFYTLLVTLVLSFPIGVAAAVYLEEFAPTNKLTDIIEVNINNLAAVPSIVFGLLGLAVFINLFGLPRSAPLVGGLVLTLMTLPTIIIASRAALKSVPPSIREAALGVGASKMQMVTHHVLPLAMPGMLTGTIIGMAQALGESAPLLMIGMVAFIVNIPGGPVDPSTVLPVQVFLWSDSPERAFVERTSAAIMVLLGFLVLMNILAVVLRRRFERRW
jgi:phosphate transport system permease protein